MSAEQESCYPASHLEAVKAAKELLDKAALATDLRPFIAPACATPDAATLARYLFDHAARSGNPPQLLVAATVLLGAATKPPAPLQIAREI